MKTVAYTDGATSRTNPGPAGIGVVFHHGGETVEICEPIGWATNNEAEYLAVIYAIEAWILNMYLEDETVEALAIFTDSALVANQANGEFKMKAPNLKKKLTRLKELLRVAEKLEAPITIQYIPREKNTHADKLSKAAASLSHDERVSNDWEE